MSAEKINSIILLVFAVWLLAFMVYMTFDMFKSRAKWKRWDRARELNVDVFESARLKKIEPDEAFHLSNILMNPTPSALALVRDRLQELWSKTND